jgi:hypothetical protein
MENNEVSVVDTEKIVNINNKLALETKIKSGTNWFFLIAGLSIINSTIYILGLNLTFVLGLGITQLIDGFSSAASSKYGGTTGIAIRIAGHGISILIAGLFVLFGIMGRKKNKLAIIIGMVVYLFDGLILLLLRDWFSAIFHGLALMGIWQGYQAINKLGELEKNGPIEIPISVKENLNNQSRISTKTSNRVVILCLCLLALLFGCIIIGIPMFSK